MVMLTAFKGNNNSSKLLLDKVNSGNITKKLLTNSFDGCERELLRYINIYNPEYIISFGRKPLINKLYIETSACCDDLCISTNFDISFLKKSLQGADLSFAFSDKAGNYLCNYVYYKGLEFLKQSNSKAKMIFIHVPDMKRFQNLDVVALWLNDFCEALRRT